MTGDSRQSIVAREDLVLFINACFACTGQGEFYGDSRGQAVSLDFLHEYTVGNYRRLYARCLAVGINHSNQAEVIARLLASGGATPDDFRAEEGALIRSALMKLPPPRVYRLFARLRRLRVNNRRTRAVIREYLAGRPDPAFDAVKYRRKVAVAAAHAHVRLDSETGAFLFDYARASFTTPIFESFRKAHFSQSAVYELPYTVAEGFAAKHGIPRKAFMAGIEPRMTANEKLRLQNASAKATGKKLEFDLARAPLTKLCLYLLSVPLAERAERREEFEAAVSGAARRTIGRSKTRLGRVACVLDRSYSMSGSREKRRRPLAVALAASHLTRALADESKDFWAPVSPVSSVSPGPSGDAAGGGAGVFAVSAKGQTRLAEALIDALEWNPDLVIVVSDGFENDPPGGLEAVVSAYRKHWSQHSVAFVHVNPVFDAETFEPKTLGPSIPTVGVRDAEDLPTMLAFARFVDGSSGLMDLESHLEERSAQFTGEDPRR